MPSVNNLASNFYKRLVLKDTIFKDYSNIRNQFCPLIVVEASREFPYIYINEEVGLKYIQIRSRDLLSTVYPGRDFLKLFEYCPRNQVYNYFTEWSHEPTLEGKTYWHSVCDVFEFSLELNTGLKQCDDGMQSDRRFSYKVCKDCYENCDFYKVLEKNGYDDLMLLHGYKLNTFNLHIISKTFTGLMDYFARGNYLLDYSERYEAFNRDAYYCNYCNRALIDNLQWVEDTFLHECTSCYNTVANRLMGWDEFDYDDEELLQAADDYLWREETFTEITNYAYNIAMHNYNSSLVSEREIFELLNPKKTYNPLSLAQSAVNAYVNSCFQ